LIGLELLRKAQEQKNELTISAEISAAGMGKPCNSVRH